MTATAPFAAVFLAAALIATAAAAQTTTVPDASNVDFDPDAQGTEEWTQTVDERNRQAIEEARRTGGTAFDAAVGPAMQPLPEPAADEPEPGTARAGYEHRDPVPIIRTPSAVTGRAYDDYGAAVAVPGQDLSDLLAVLIEEWSRPPEIVAIGYDAASARPDEPGGETAASSAPPPVQRVIDAGRPLYARTLYEVNSDVPGPVLVEILEPPLAGAVATGTFTRIRDTLALHLTRVEMGGVSVPVDGWAVGLDCACFAIEGEVDRHWFERVIMPAAIAFAEGWSRAIARPATTVNVEGGVVVQSVDEATSEERIYEGIAAATGPAAAVLTEDAPRAMTVSIPRNTELAVTFTAAPDVAGIAAGGGGAP